MEKINIVNTSYMAIPGLIPGTYIRGNGVNIQTIIGIVSNEFGVTEKEMKSVHRYRRFVEARMTAMFLIRKHTSYSLFEIGKIFGGRDHTTVLYSMRTVYDLIDSETNFKNRLLLIENKLA